MRPITRRTAREIRRWARRGNPSSLRLAKAALRQAAMADGDPEDMFLRQQLGVTLAHLRACGAEESPIDAIRASAMEKIVQARSE